MNNKFKAIIFDFFDVIHADEFNAWMKLHGLKREGKQAEISKNLDTGKINMGQFYEQLGKITQQNAKEVEDEFNKARKFDYKVIELIFGLQNRFRLGLISNADSKYLRPILRENNLEQLFDYIAISSELGFAKPSVEIFQITLKYLQVYPQETIFIDDSLTNIKAAKNIGITGILHTDSINLKKSLRDVGAYS